MHWLTVPKDPAAALRVAHSSTCVRRTARGTTTYHCTVGRLAEQFGLEVWFCRVGNEDDGYASPGRKSLQPGDYLIGAETEKVLRDDEGNPRATVNSLHLLTAA